jgi:hypothetical protein
MRARRAFAPVASVACVTSIAAFACSIAACHWDPSHPFDRNAPEVTQAIGALDAGDAGAATVLLEEYLSTGPCKEASIGTPGILRRRPNGTFDLGLSLFRMAEAFGRRFGEEELDGGAAEEVRQQRAAQIGCALAVVQAIAADESQPVDVRLHARYLEGNLQFLGTDYESAVQAYDKALTLAPGLVDAGDAVSRDAAWNRAIALRRIEDKKDAGNDASNDASQDGARDAEGDGSQSPDGSGQEDSGQDSGKDSGGEPDAGQDSGNDASPPPPQKDAGPPPPPPRANQDERILDQLENAPTVQQEDAKKRAGKHRVRGMADK